MKLIELIKRIFCWRRKPTPVEKYQQLSDIEWEICPEGPSAWNKHAGLRYQKVIIGKQPCIRLACRKSSKNEDGWQTAAIKSIQAYGDGKFECWAKFKSGKATWPAIWMSHPGGAKDNYATYYEIDLSEYYETRDNTETTYHYPQSMRKEAKFVNTKTKIKPNEWNHFMCKWDERGIEVYINDNLVLNITNTNDSTYFPVNKEDRTFQIILSMQYTNRWLSEPDLNELPLWMDVKDIKVYKKL